MKNFTQISNKALRAEGLSPTAKILFCLLLSYNPCYPSYKTLQRQLGVSKATLSKSIQELVSKRMITYERGSLSSKKSNEYRILPESEWSLGSISKPKNKGKGKIIGSNIKPNIGSNSELQKYQGNNTNIQDEVVVSEAVSAFEASPLEDAAVSTPSPLPTHPKSTEVLMMPPTWKDIQLAAARLYSTNDIDLYAHCTQRDLDPELEIITCHLSSTPNPAKVALSKLALKLSGVEGTPNQHITRALSLLTDEALNEVQTAAKELYPGYRFIAL